MIRVLLGLIPAIIFGLILFLINPILGVLWVLWLVGVAVFTLNRNKRGK